MAEYEIEDTKTGKTYVIEGPDGATEDELMAFVQSELGEGPEREKPPLLSEETATGVLQSINQGLSFGYGDEAVSGISAALGRNPSTGEYFDYSRPLGKSYSENLAAERGGLKQFREDRPYLAMGSEVAGAAPIALATGGSTAVIRPGATLAGNAGRGFSTAGLYGGAYGYGQGEGGAANRLQNAGSSAMISALLGGGIPVATHFGGKAYQGAANRLMASLGSKTAGENMAARKVAESIMRDNPGMSPEAAFRRAQRQARLMGPEAMLADTGENARALAGSMSRMPGEGKTMLTQRVLDRQEGVSTPMRVREGGQAQRVDEMLGDIEGNRLKATTDKLYAERSAAGRQAFDEALDVGPIHSDRLKAFVDDPVTDGSIKRGLELQRLEALAEGKPFKPNDYAITGFDEAGAPVLGEVPTMRTYQAMKEGLDEMVNESVDKFGRLTKRGVALKKVRDELVKELDAFNPAYAEARQTWAGPTQQLNAARSGYRFMNKGEFQNEDEVAAALARMSEPEKHHFRIGVVQALRDKVGDKVVRGDITKDLMGKEGLEKKLQLAFGDARTFKRYKRMLEGEEAMFKTYDEVLRNSKTAPRLAADADANIDPKATAEMARGILQDPLNPVQWGRSLARGAGSAAGRLSRPPESARAEMARILAGRETGSLTKRMERIALENEKRRRMARALMGTNLAVQ